MPALLKTEKVYLRALEPQDVDLLYIWENDPEVWVVSDTLVPFSKYTLKEFVKSSHTDIYVSKQLRLMVDDYDGHSVGAIDIFDFDPFNRRAGIGILIDKHFRQHGFAEDAVRCVCHYLFTTLQLHQVFCNVMSDNEISLHLFEKVGFVQCGVKKDWMRRKNHFIDVHILQLINENEK